MREVLKCCSRGALSTDPLVPSKVLVREVLSSDHYRNCSETISFQALMEVPTRSIEICIRIINSVSPINHKFNYLKRIKGGTILIGPEENCDKSKIDAIFLQLGQHDLLTETIAVQTIQVPAYPVLTTKQYQEANGIWPMRVTTPLVDAEAGVDEVTLKEFCAKFDSLLRRTQKPGVMGACLMESPDGSIAATGVHSKGDLLECKHCVFDACYQVGKVSEYLATDFRVYCIGEPCIMCSMALLHSRVAEVVYLASEEQSQRGFLGLGTTVSIHCEKKLNHKFRVFKLIENS